MLRAPHGMTATGAGPKIALVAFPALILAILALVHRQDTVALTFMPGWLAWAVGVPLLLAGLAAYVATVRTFVREFPSGKLITSGPYRLCRNPLYLSVALLILPAISVLLRTWALLAVGAVVFAAVVVFTRAEDEALERVFGDEYRAYRARVPGFIPRLPAMLPRVSRT